MKKKLTLAVIFITTALVYASFIVPYNNAKPPNLSLPKAYESALTALGAATNEFHCLSASVETVSSPDGEWLFTFYSTNSKPKFVTVEFNGKIHIENMRAY